MKIHSVALIGAGAIGSYFIWGLTGKPDIDFMLIAEGERKERLQKGVVINGERYTPPVRTPEEAGPVDLVLIAVKYGAIREAAAMAAHLIKDDTIVLSLLNGVDSEEIVGEAVGADHMLYSLMRIQSTRRDGEVRFYPERAGGLLFGEKDTAEETERVKAVEEFFGQTEIRCTHVPDMHGEMWLKYAGNISRNLPQAIIAVGAGAYRDSEHVAWIRDRLNDEVHAVAESLGIEIPRHSYQPSITTGPLAKKARFSTLQDLDEKRHTEVDMFLGVLIRLAKERGIPVPCSECVYHLIKALEEKNDGLFDYE